MTLPEHLIDTIKAAVDRGEARSVSAYIATRLASGVPVITSDPEDLGKLDSTLPLIAI